MFPDLFLPNLLVFAIGQVAALVHLRTGRVRLGIALMVLLWGSADWALLARFLHGHTDVWYRGALLLLQGVALGSGAALAFALWRRRWSATAKQSEALFAAAFTGYLRDELPAAARLLRRLCRNDPWDVGSLVLLGNVQRAQGDPKRALASYRRAHSLDRHGQYRAFLSEQMRLLAAPAANRAT